MSAAEALVRASFIDTFESVMSLLSFLTHVAGNLFKYPRPQAIRSWLTASVRWPVLEAFGRHCLSKPRQLSRYYLHHCNLLGGGAAVGMELGRERMPLGR